MKHGKTCTHTHTRPHTSRIKWDWMRVCESFNGSRAPARAVYIWLSYPIDTLFCMESAEVSL